MGQEGQPYYPPPPPEGAPQQPYYGPPQGGYYQPQPQPNPVYIEAPPQDRGSNHNCCMACLIGCLACCALESLCDMCC